MRGVGDERAGGESFDRVFEEGGSVMGGGEWDGVGSTGEVFGLMFVELVLAGADVAVPPEDYNVYLVGSGSGPGAWWDYRGSSEGLDGFMKMLEVSRVDYPQVLGCSL